MADLRGVIKLKDIKQVAGTLVLVGAINWGLVGLLSLNLVSSLFGAGSTLEKVVYLVVGLSGVYLAWEMFASPKDKKK